MTASAVSERGSTRIRASEVAVTEVGERKKSREAITEIENPSSIDPESPKKSRAGRRLRGRNPRAADKSRSDAPSPDRIAVRAIRADTEMPPQRPSRPSIRLNAFDKSTLKRMDPSTPSAPSKSRIPHAAAADAARS